MYKLQKDNLTGKITSIGILENPFTVIPIDPANTDYANFKREINDETAQLQDADGNLMSAQQAKAYVATLP